MAYYCTPKMDLKAESPALGSAAGWEKGEEKAQIYSQEKSLQREQNFAAFVMAEVSLLTCFKACSIPIKSIIFYSLRRILSRTQDSRISFACGQLSPLFLPIFLQFGPWARGR
jgi:hypothetical protein